MKWDEMTAEERNALVAEKVFGRKIYRKNMWGRWLLYHEARPGILEAIPRYTESLDVAWDVARRINNPNNPAIPDYQDYANFIDALTEIVGSDLFFDLFYCDHNGDHLTPEIICKAALKAVGCEVE